jgi:hypothetical protein
MPYLLNERATAGAILSAVMHSEGYAAPAQEPALVAILRTVDADNPPAALFPDWAGLLLAAGATCTIDGLCTTGAGAGGGVVTAADVTGAIEVAAGAVTVEVIVRTVGVEEAVGRSAIMRDVGLIEVDESGYDDAAADAAADTAA